MSKSDVNGILRSYNGEKLKVFEAARAQKAAIEQMQKQAAEIDTYARDNIKDYKKLSSPAQSQIRRIIEDGRAKGVSDSDVLAYAKVAAHSGLDIVFDKGMNYRGTNEQGEDTYSDGFYSASRNAIFVNPEASRTQERLLIHELDHAIRTAYKRDVGGAVPYTRAYKMAVDGVSEDIKKSIKEKYGDDPDVNADEANAYYAEIAFSNKHVLEKLIEAEPTLKEKILNFFKGASEDYADVPKLSGAAKRYYRTYKKLFDEFSARNAENNAMEPFTNKNGSNVNENSVSDNVRTINGNNMSVSDRQYAVEEQRKFAEYNKPITTADTDSIHSIAAQKRKLGQSLSVNAFVKEDIEVTQKWAHKFYQELGVKSPFFRAWYGDWRAHDKSQRKIVSVPTIDISDVVLSTGDYKIDDTGWTVYAGKTLNDDTRHHTGGNKINVKSLSTIDEILNNAILLDTVASEPDTNKKSPNTAFLHKLYTLIEYEGQTYIAKTTVEEFYNQGKNGVSRKAYNLKAIKIEPAGGQFRIKNSSSSVPVTDSIYSIADLYKFVKSYDKDFTPAPEISPLLLNKDGTPKVFYHGTNAEFKQFDLSKSGSNFGNVAEGMFFFTDKKQAYPNSAKDYAREAVKTKGGSEQIYEVYIAMQKPLVIDSRFSYDPVSYYDANQERIYEQYFEGDYDGIIVRDSTGNSSTSTLVMVDNPSQIKSATDNIGTFSPYENDIQYALSLDEDGISGAEVLSWFENKPKGDGKIDLEATVARGLPYKRGKSDLTVGELRKVIANSIHEKVYSKKDALRVVNKFSGSSGLTVKAREEIADTIWQFLNEAPDIEYRADMAQDIAEFIVAKILVDKKAIM